MSPSATAPTAQKVTSALGNGARPIQIAPTLETVQHLNSLVASTEELKQAGYVVEPLTDEDIEQKKRCLKCGVRVNKKPRERKPKQHQPTEADQQPSVEGSDSQVLENGTPQNADTEHPKKPLLRCHFHPGNVVYKVWTCCGKHVSAAPCTHKEDHEVQDSDDYLVRLEMERRWQFHPTPPRPQPTHRVAVAIDCEMGTSFDGDTELIRVTVVDYFTGEALVDRLVYPDIEMKHFNTRWSGITRSDMERARRRGECIMGRDGARRAVFDYVGLNTIVVGHGAQNDLSSLRWIHDRVVDSYMIESAVRKEAKLKAEKEEQEKKARELGEQEEEEDEEKEADGEPKGELQGQKEDGQKKKKEKRGKGHPDGMSLKALAMKRLGRAIQVGKNGHDSLEDALAARDLVHAHIIGLGKLREFTANV